MNNDLQIAKQGGLTVSSTPATLTQYGDCGVQIAQVANLTHNVTYVIAGAPVGIHGQQNTSVTINTDCYNLFVMGGEEFDRDHFLVPKDRALTESTSQEMKDKYAHLDDAAIEELKKFPAIFASENEMYGRTTAEHRAIYGLIRDIKVQDNGIKVSFYPLSYIPQQRLNELCFELGISKASGYNEFNRTHWALKRINLIEALTDAGISVLAPTI